MLKFEICLERNLRKVSPSRRLVSADLAVLMMTASGSHGLHCYRTLVDQRLPAPLKVLRLHLPWLEIPDPVLVSDRLERC